MAYKSRYRRRRRNSHYGVLIALLLAVVIAVPVGFRVLSGVAGAVFGGNKNEVIFQVYNNKVLTGDALGDLGGAAPFVDASGNTVVPLRAVTEAFDLDLNWEQVSKTASITRKKDTIRVQVGSKTLRYNEETVQMESVPVVENGTTYVPVADICKALSWNVYQVDAARGDFVVVSKSKKELSDDKLEKAVKAGREKLGPSRQQVLEGSVVLRPESAQLLQGGELKTMKDSGKKGGCRVLNQEGKIFVPLEAAVTTLGGTAEYDGKAKWALNIAGRESTVTDGGKIKAAGKNIKGDGIAVYRDEETSRLYVSPQALAAILGQTYSGLGGENGAFSMTNMSLDGFDSQKAYLLSLEKELTASPALNVPEADNYIALTFDDGPTGGSTGLTVELLDALKERQAHATFFMCGYRIKDFNTHMERYLAEGHELGNHTMDHPMETLTGISADQVREQVASNNDLIESYCGKKPLLMRPVGGAVNDTVQSAMKELGMPIINWDLDTLDWKNRDANSVKNNILEQAHDGAIVLMHDMYPTTVEGVIAAIDELNKREESYAFVTVSELAAIKGVTLEAGVVYTNLKEGMDMSASAEA